MTYDAPPQGFEADFFDWLERVGEQGSCTFIDRGGLSVVEIAALERSLPTALPKQLQTYYLHCNPWGRWTRPIEVWEQTVQRIRSAGIHDALVPIDLMSQLGNHTLALVFADGSFEIVDIDRSGDIRRAGTDLRRYFLRQVEA